MKKLIAEFYDVFLRGLNESEPVFKVTVPLCRFVVRKIQERNIKIERIINGISDWTGKMPLGLTTVDEREGYKVAMEEFNRRVSLAITKLRELDNE